MWTKAINGTENQKKVIVYIIKSKKKDYLLMRQKWDLMKKEKSKSNFLPWNLKIWWARRVLLQLLLKSCWESRVCRRSCCQWEGGRWQWHRARLWSWGGDSRGGESGCLLGNCCAGGSLTQGRVRMLLCAHPSPDPTLPLPPDEGCGSTGLGSLEEGPLLKLLQLYLE